MLRLYTDASILNSGRNNPSKKICGLGIVVVDKVGKEDVRYLQSKYTSQHKDDINIGEMLAILEGLSIIHKDILPVDSKKYRKPQIQVITDSSNCVSYLNGKVPGEGKREFTESQKEKHIMLRALCHKVKSYSKYYDLTFTHVKGHTNYLQEHSINNSLADVMARDGLRKYIEESRPKNMNRKTIER